MVVLACAALVACGDAATPAPGTTQGSAPAGANGLIVLSGKRTTVNDAGLYTVQPDGSGLTHIMNTVDGDVTPSIAKDGRTIVFSDKDAAITVINADGTGRRQLTPASDDNANPPVPGHDLPVIAPNGTKIAFLQDRNPGHFHDLYVAGIDGTNPTLVQAVAEHDETTIHPSFSDDGTEIVYEDIVAPDTARGIFTVRVDGTMREKVGTLPSGAVGDLEPSWSRDGQRIAFSEKVGELHAIFVEQLDGSGHQRVSGPDPANDTQPSWSQDSKRIVYEMGTGGAIGISGADGSDPRNLGLVGEFHTPRWATGS